MTAVRSVVVLFALVVVAGCGGSSKGTQPSALKNRLLATSAFASFTCVQGPPPGAVGGPPGQAPARKRTGCPLSLKRAFEWANPVDYTFQGVPLPEAYSPSRAVDFIKKAGFEAGVGQQFATKDRSVNVEVEALEFRSGKGARDVLAWLHARNLELPCYASCTELPSRLTVSGIPDAQGAQQLPQPVTPPGGEQGFTAYAVQFPIGRFLYVVQGTGPPGSIEAKQIVDPARTLYKRVSGLPANKT